MTDIQVGDKVRVSRTIVVTEVYVDHSVSNGVRWFPSNEWEIEVIEKAKPKLKGWRHDLRFALQGSPLRRRHRYT